MKDYKKLYENSIEDTDKISEEKRLPEYKNSIRNMINFYNKWSGTIIFPELILYKKLFKKANYQRHLKYNPIFDGHIFIGEGEVYKFYKISEFSQSLKSNLITHTSYKENHCHEDSIILAHCYELKGKSSKILTGYVYSPEERILHSVVEIESVEGTKLIADFTMNTIMTKEDYIKLRNFEELNSMTYDEYIKYLYVAFTAQLDLTDLRYIMVYGPKIYEDIKNTNPEIIKLAEEKFKTLQESSQSETRKTKLMNQIERLKGRNINILEIAGVTINTILRPISNFIYKQTSKQFADREYYISIMSQWYSNLNKGFKQLEKDGLKEDDILIMYEIEELITKEYFDMLDKLNLDILEPGNYSAMKDIMDETYDKVLKLK